MQPPAEHVHWLFATGFLALGLCLLAEAIVGTEIWRRRAWRAYLWPGLAFFLGVFMWPVMTFFTNSTLHMLAHGAWAEVLMGAGAVELALVRGKLRSSWWPLAMTAAFVVSGAAFLVHEQNEWLFQRSSFLHHLLGWTLLAPRWSTRSTASAGRSAGTSCSKGCSPPPCSRSRARSGLARRLRLPASRSRSSSSP